MEEGQQADGYQRVTASLRVAYGPASAAMRDGWARKGFTAEERHRFLDLLRERSAASLLEVGAGPGHDSLYFQDHGLRVLCTDLSPDMVERCGKDEEGPVDDPRVPGPPLLRVPLRPGDAAAYGRAVRHPVVHRPRNGRRRPLPVVHAAETRRATRIGSCGPPTADRCQKPTRSRS